MKETEDQNKEYREAVVTELAKRMKDAGYSLTYGKMFPILIGIILALISVVYATLRQADASQENGVTINTAAIAELQVQRNSTNIILQNMSDKLDLICQTIGAKCIKLDLIIK